MYPRIPWELVADPFRAVQHILGTTDLRDGLIVVSIPIFRLMDLLY